MGSSEKNSDRKMIATIVCFFIGFFLVWNISAHVSDFYELRLNAETCERAKALGLRPSADCVITAPYRPIGLGSVGYLVLPDGSDMPIEPLASSRANKSMEWSVLMKVQLGVALLFWVATLVLLLSAFRSRK